MASHSTSLTRSQPCIYFYIYTFEKHSTLKNCAGYGFRVLDNLHLRDGWFGFLKVLTTMFLLHPCYFVSPFVSLCTCRQSLGKHFSRTKQCGPWFMLIFVEIGVITLCFLGFLHISSELHHPFPCWSHITKLCILVFSVFNIFANILLTHDSVWKIFYHCCLLGLL